MKGLELEAQGREIFGKQVNSLRRKGITPVNLYGHGVKSTALQVETRTLQRTLSQAGETTLISLKVPGAKQHKTVMVRGIQRNPKSSDLVHVDFYQVKLTEKIKVEIPLVFKGEAPAVKEKGGILLHSLNSVPIEALPADLPHSLEVDLSGLIEIDQAIHIKDIPLGKGVTLLASPEQLVVKVAPARREEEVVKKEEVPAAAEAKAEGEAEAEAAAPEAQKRPAAGT